MGLHSYIGGFSFLVRKSVVKERRKLKMFLFLIDERVVEMNDEFVLGAAVLETVA
jgi:hypothetical protein